MPEASAADPGKAFPPEAARGWLHLRLVRWASPLGAGLCCALILLGGMAVHYRHGHGGINSFLLMGFQAPLVRSFAAAVALTQILPVYLVGALLAWGLTLAWAAALRRPWPGPWGAGEGFALTGSALLWIHLVLWWEVPATLLLLPGLRILPFWAAFPLLALGALAYPGVWVRRHGLGWPKGAALVAGWLCLWTLIPLAVMKLPRPAPAAKGGAAPARILVLGVDGLGADVGQAAASGFIGTPYPNAYTVIPATRLLWNILWGGDPQTYTVGGLAPGLEEFTEATPLLLLEEARRQGWKPRFYTDDGGTLGLAGRQLPLDDLLMPAAGWENFVNSNLSASFPLFAAWENWSRAFPTTNPWAPLDGGLREALRLGRGSGWVMFHSCLGHAPIYLRRHELAQLPRWWTLRPDQLEPAHALAPAPRTADPRADPVLAYTLRMRAILRAWQPVWNSLGGDPQYGQATRILFSDHGERFYPGAGTTHLGGVHGYNLDPWEARVMLKIAGPHFDPGPGAPHPATLSLLALRDGFRQTLATGRAMAPASLEAAYPAAPLRLNSLDLGPFTAEPPIYRHLEIKAIAAGITLLPGGAWFTRYLKTAGERGEDVSIGWGRGSGLEVLRPLKAGGAHRFRYEGFALRTVETVSEEVYVAEKTRVLEALAGGGGQPQR
jgi:hypothetical protein